MSLQQGNSSELLLDMEVLANVAALSSEQEFLSTLIEHYLADSKRLFASIKQACIAQDKEEIDSLLHAMKGSAVHIGCCAIAGYVSSLRNKLASIEPGSLESSLDTLLALIEETEKELRHYIVQCERV